jgi:queuine tRNA-ribosyltransferase
MASQFHYEVEATLPNGLGRAGVITTPHGQIETPAFIPVGTKASVKAVTPEAMEQLGAQAILANAFHLYLQPGADIVDEAGGLGRFMNWKGPTFTDSGGFQVMSLGPGFKKVIAMETADAEKDAQQQTRVKDWKPLARVDEDGVDFRSPIDGSKHRFTPEISMGVQHKLGADIMFAFDELTTLLDPYEYQAEAVERTRRWAGRCLAEHRRLTQERSGKPYQALFGVIQGAQHENLRRLACQGLEALGEDGGFDGYGIGGALEKHAMGEIVAWCAEELPDDKPRHLLGISEPEDVFAAVEAGVDTFDCVMPSRVARNGAIYTADGRYSVDNAPYRRDFGPLEEGCDCYTCAHYTRAYLHHLFKAKELLAATLATIHNERFTVRLVAAVRDSILTSTFASFRADFLSRYAR